MVDFNANTGGRRGATFYASIAFAVLATLIFLLRARAGINILDFGDETEKFVAGRLIGQGLTLYGDVFAHHGPVQYIIAHLYTALVSPTDFTKIRWVMVGLALISAAAIYGSPVLKSRAARLWGVGVYLGLLSSIWVLHSVHMLLYHQIGGFLFVIPAAQLLLPLLLGESPTRAGLVASGLAIVMACFTAYSFGPSAVLFTAAAAGLLAARDGWPGVRQHALPFFVGVAIGLGGVLAWMAVYADLKGYFVYHFYFNQKIYAQFIGFDLRQLKNLFQLSFEPLMIVHTFVLLGLVGWLAALVRVCLRFDSRWRMLWSLASLALFLLAVFMLNPRGGKGFQDAAFEILNLAMFALVLALAFQRRAGGPLRSWIVHVAVLALVSLLLLEYASRSAVSSPHSVPKAELKHHVSPMMRAEDGLSRFVRTLVKPEDKVLALIFNPAFYVRADRLPASGYFYYLPWQAAYNRQAIPGYRIDLCEDIRKETPAVIWFDDWAVWGQYRIDEYEPCIPALIRAKYVRLEAQGQLYLRSDLLTPDMASLQAANRTLRATPPLAASGPLALRMSPEHRAHGGPLARIGIRFGTHQRQNAGRAELRLRAADGAEHRQSFALAELADNAYRYFDLDGGTYASGEIVALDGGGISAWESVDAPGDALTCISYEYADGTRRFTPGCPLF